MRSAAALRGLHREQAGVVNAPLSRLRNDRTNMAVVTITPARLSQIASDCRATEDCLPRHDQCIR